MLTWVIPEKSNPTSHTQDFVNVWKDRSSYLTNSREMDYYVNVEHVQSGYLASLILSHSSVSGEWRLHLRAYRWMLGRRWSFWNVVWTIAAVSGVAAGMDLIRRIRIGPNAEHLERIDCQPDESLIKYLVIFRNKQGTDITDVKLVEGPFNITSGSVKFHKDNSLKGF